MSTKITLANGTVLEYDGTISVSSDGSLNLGPAIEQPVHIDPVNESEMVTADDLIQELLQPQTGRFNELRLVDAMLNITEVHFTALDAMCRSDVFRNTDTPWRTEYLVAAYGWTDGAAKSRVDTLIKAGLVDRVGWGQFCLVYGVCDTLYAYHDEIVKERDRRHGFVLGAYDPARKKSN